MQNPVTPKEWLILQHKRKNFYSLKIMEHRESFLFEDFNEAKEFYEKSKYEDPYLSVVAKDATIVSKMKPLEQPFVELPSGVYKYKVPYLCGDYVPGLAPMVVRFDGCEFEHDCLKTVKDDLELFLANKDKYLSLGGLYKKSYLLQGPPGTGKTTLLRNLVNKFNNENYLVIYTDKALDSSIVESLNKDPRMKVVVFEELTTSLNDPEEVKEILNFLDGENSLDNCITFATTNYPEQLPDNIVDRKGRFDIVLEVGLLAEESSIAFAENLLKRPLEAEEKEFVKKLTVAEIKDACLKLVISGISIKQYYAEIRVHKNLKDSAFTKRRHIGFDKAGFE